MPRVFQRISNEELPNNIQQAIEKILLHRKQIKINALIGSPVAILVTALINSHPIKDNSPIPYSIVTVGISALGALYAHREKYAKNELALYRALRGTTDLKVKALLQNHPYIVVDKKGNLVGKRIAPKIWFMPIGRRRIPTKRRPTQVRKPKLRPIR